jgi:hypothetical protein
LNCILRVIPRSTQNKSHTFSKVLVLSTDIVNQYNIRIF